MRPVLVLIVAYLLGSIPFGFLIVRAKEGADVRASGSGATGATNVSRRAGKWAGVLTLALDAAKGALAVEFARRFLATSDARDWLVAGAAVVAIFAHCFPVWLSFRGGKGVATGVGAFLALAPVAVLGAAFVFVSVVLLTRYVSLGSITATAAFPLCVWLLDAYAKSLADFAPTMMAAILGGALIISMHRANIARLLQGTESKFK